MNVAARLNGWNPFSRQLGPAREPKLAENEQDEQNTMQHNTQAYTSIQ